MGAERSRSVAWVAMVVVLLGAIVVGVTDDDGPRTPGERERDIAATVACPQCDGQSVADSDATAARAVRNYVAERVAEGAGDDQIRGELADRYGDQILLTPGDSGLAGLVWALPVVALVAAFAGLALAFRRWRSRVVTTATDADRLLVDRASVGSSGGPAAAEFAADGEGEGEGAATGGSAGVHGGDGR